MGPTPKWHAVKHYPDDSRGLLKCSLSRSAKTIRPYDRRADGFKGRTNPTLLVNLASLDVVSSSNTTVPAQVHIPKVDVEVFSL